MLRFSARYLPARFCLPLIALVPLSACGGSSGGLDALQKQIQEEVVQQGASSVKRVMCDPPKSGDEKSILCTGLLESGSGFEIPVQKQDDQSYKWEILSIKGLLNMLQVQRSIQDGLKAEVGEVSLDCGAGTAVYKVANPGDTLDCQFKVVESPTDKKPGESPSKTADQNKPLADAASGKAESNKSAKPPIEKSGKVTISIMPSGDISWQRIVVGKPDAIGKPDATAEKSATGTSKSDGSKSDSKSEKSEEAKAAGAKSPDGMNKVDGTEAKDSPTAMPPGDAAAPAQNADDALNQGAVNLDDEQP